MSAKNVIVEILFPELCDLAGDNGNVMYLKACLPDATFHETTLTDEPFLAAGDPDIVLLGHMTERDQTRAVERLRPYRDRIIELADAGCVMLFTGAAAEILGRGITFYNGEKVDGLGIFDFETRGGPISDRINDFFVGPFEGFEVIGWKSQFNQAFGDNTGCFFSEATRGMGINRSTKLEGFRRNNLIATWVLGPMLPFNPDFVRWMLDAAGATDAQVAFEDVARSSFVRRHGEMLDPKRKAS